MIRHLPALSVTDPASGVYPDAADEDAWPPLACCAVGNWLSGFSGNLVADLLAIWIVYLLAQRFAEKWALDKVVMRAGWDTERDYGDPVERFQIVIVNLSDRPILEIMVLADIQPKALGPIEMAGKTITDFEVDGQPMDYVLQAGQTALSGWYSVHNGEETLESLVVHFRTASGRNFQRTLSDRSIPTVRWRRLAWRARRVLSPTHRRWRKFSPEG
ncbi:MAG: hypothetical protein QOE58_3068 [Actinomycetota bacterium]|nr:hypothetical protein [Actinomycetota bacterium]